MGAFYGASKVAWLGGTARAGLQPKSVEQGKWAKADGISFAGCS